jgi:hypothetical protein
MERDDVGRRRIAHEFVVQRGDARIGNKDEANLGQPVQDGSFAFRRGDVGPRASHGFRRRGQPQLAGRNRTLTIQPDQLGCRAHGALLKPKRGTVQARRWIAMSSSR